MAQDRMAVLLAIMEQGVIPVFYHPHADACIAAVQACADGGAYCVEFTNRGDFAPQLFFEIARHFAKADSAVILGVGSVLDAPTAALYIASGARFVVGPVLNADVAKLCNRRKIPYLPGCGTASEISLAEELGCEIVKLFPAGAIGGPDFLKAILGPMPWTRVMPTGGVEATEESLRAWFDAGAAAVGIGSGLLSTSWIEDKDRGAIESKVRQTIAIARKVRVRHSARLGSGFAPATRPEAHCT